mmetsp:Transcript_102195/g.318307  ORF Transcript_102195/g.318307 Transcript_102195/m.318307 type:complete len:322 (-) Transcript_102195:128-1093(-)
MAAVAWHAVCIGLCLPLIQMPVQAERTNISVIGAGPPRTGTHSLAVALKVLGYNIVDSTTYLFEPTLRGIWKLWMYIPDIPLDVAVDPLVDQGVNATLGAPYFGAYKELMHMFPDAKVILTVKDPQDWYISMVARFGIVYKSRIVSAYLSWVLYWAGFNWRQAYMGIESMRGDFMRLISCSTGTELFEPEGRKLCLNGYDRHVAEVQRVVPPERLLVFDVKDGWGPLCKFLGVEVPDVPFPYWDPVAWLPITARAALIALAAKGLALLLCCGVPLCCLAWRLLRRSGLCRRCGALCRWCGRCGRRAPAAGATGGPETKKAA